jgi:hypothetical protein
VNSTPAISSAHSPVSVQGQQDDFFRDSFDPKDVYFLDDPFDETRMSLRVPSAFESAGYEIRQWGKAQYHPAWILRARNKTAPRFGKRDPRFIQHVLQVLKSAEVNARKSDLVTDRTGERILVSFLWPLGVRSWRFDKKLGWAPDRFA